MSNADLIERATWLENGDDGAFSRMIRELVAALEAAEARAVEAERRVVMSRAESEGLGSLLLDLQNDCIAERQGRIEAERQLAEARKALEKIADGNGWKSDCASDALSNLPAPAPKGSIDE